MKTFIKTKLNKKIWYQVKSLQRQEGKDLLTVLTCTPYGINSHRLLVTGVRVPMEPTVRDADDADAVVAALAGQ